MPVEYGAALFTVFILYETVQGNVFLRLPFFKRLFTPDRDWFLVETEAATDFVLFVLLSVVQDGEKNEKKMSP